MPLLSDITVSSLLVKYGSVTLVLVICILFYFRIARHFRIIDKPNERSSHVVHTIRGGGIIFPLAALIWFFTNDFRNFWFISGMLMISVVSFIDDVRTLSSKIRIVAHFLAVSLLFWQAGWFNLPWYFILIGYIGVTGWINVFNFMDGINGISAIFGFVTLATLLWINSIHQMVPDDLIIYAMISVAIFSFFNFRKKALAFAGDIGSVSLAFFIAFLMVLLLVRISGIEYILFLAIYGIDGAFTILFRLLNHENIFKPHRSHLYQLLSNEMKWPHTRVSFLYGFFQALVNLGTIILMESGKMSPFIFILIILLLSFIYLVIRNKVKKRILLTGVDSVA